MRTDEQTSAQWKQIAFQLLEEVYKMVNTPAMVGGETETGVAIMFFKQRGHGGKATVVSTTENPEDLMKILRHSLAEIEKGDKVSVERPASTSSMQ